MGCICRYELKPIGLPVFALLHAMGSPLAPDIPLAPYRLDKVDTYATFETIG